jgi:hypothetical protein
MRRLFLLCCIVLFLTGCVQRIHPAFYAVVKDHQILLNETNDAVIGSIQADLEENRHRLTADQVRSIENLILRLQFLQRQGVTIEKYVESRFVDEQLISELIRLRWSEQGV